MYQSCHIIEVGLQIHLVWTILRTPVWPLINLIAYINNCTLVTSTLNLQHEEQSTSLFKHLYCEYFIEAFLHCPPVMKLKHLFNNPMKRNPLSSPGSQNAYEKLQWFCSQRRQKTSHQWLQSLPGTAIWETNFHTHSNILRRHLWEKRHKDIWNCRSARRKRTLKL